MSFAASIASLAICLLADSSNTYFLLIISMNTLDIVRKRIWMYYRISIFTTLHTGNNFLYSPRTPCRHCPTISRNDFQQLPPLRGQLSVCCVASRRGEKVALFRGRRCHRCCCCLLLALPRRSRRCRRWHKTCEASAQRSHLAGERAAKRTAKAKRKLSGVTGKQWKRDSERKRWAKPIVDWR